jgi:hypothetical protein
MRNFLVVVVSGVFALLSGQALALDRPGVDLLRDKGVEKITEKGLDAGIAFLGDKANGFLDLQGVGLHTWGMTPKGIVIFDHSGQTDKGMDLNGIPSGEGGMFVDRVVTAVKAEKKAGLTESSFPHPITGEVKPQYMACQLLSDKDTVFCVAAWVP